MKYRPYLLLLLFIVIGCNSNPYDKEYVAPEFKQILDRSVSVLNDEFLFSYTSYITVVDSLLIMGFRTNSTAGYFHIFNKHTGEYLKSFSGIGRGPGELLNEPSFSRSTDPTNKKLYVPKDLNSRSIVVFDISQAIEKEFVPFEETNGTLVAQGYLHFKDDIFLATDKHGAFRYALVNSASDTIAMYHTYPIVTEVDRDDETARFAFYRSMSGVNIKPDKKKFASITSNGLLIEIFDLSGDIIELLCLRRYIKPLYKIRSSNAVHVAVKEMAGCYFTVTDNYLYGIMYFEHDQSNIWVFDWEGLPIKRYQLDKNVYRIAIDEEAGFAYVQIIDDEPSIGRFPL